MKEVTFPGQIVYFRGVEGVKGKLRELTSKERDSYLAGKKKPDIVETAMKHAGIDASTLSSSSLSLSTSSSSSPRSSSSSSVFVFDMDEVEQDSSFLGIPKERSEDMPERKEPEVPEKASENKPKEKIIEPKRDLKVAEKQPEEKRATEDKRETKVSENQPHKKKAKEDKKEPKKVSENKPEPKKVVQDKKLKVTGNGTEHLAENAPLAKKQKLDVPLPSLPPPPPTIEDVLSPLDGKKGQENEIVKVLQEWRSEQKQQLDTLIRYAWDTRELLREWSRQPSVPIPPPIDPSYQSRDFHVQWNRYQQQHEVRPKYREATDPTRNPRH